jgi:tripartite-type tricarboxylate transporter receptor subunit TctC
MQIIRTIATAATLLAATAPTVAQNWPSRRLTLLVAFSAGSSSDAIARIVADGPNLRQTLVVENVSGGGVLLARRRVAKAAPDGYQFVIGNVGTFAQSQWLYKKPLYNAVTDFAPVALLTVEALVLIARKDFPAIAGRVDYDCLSLPLALPQIVAKTIKPIAILSKKRSSSLPNLPSSNEQGLTDFDVPSWYAFFLPAGTPSVLVEKLNLATAAALDMPSVQQSLKQVGDDVNAPDRRSPEYLARFVSAQIMKWEGPIKASGI